MVSLWCFRERRGKIPRNLSTYSKTAGKTLSFSLKVTSWELPFSCTSVSSLFPEAFSSWLSSPVLEVSVTEVHMVTDASPPSHLLLQLPYVFPEGVSPPSSTSSYYRCTPSLGCFWQRGAGQILHKARLGPGLKHLRSWPPFGQSLHKHRQTRKNPHLRISPSPTW